MEEIGEIGIKKGEFGIKNWRDGIKKDIWIYIICLAVILSSFIVLYNIADERQTVIKYYNEYINDNCICNQRGEPIDTTFYADNQEYT